MPIPTSENTLKQATDPVDSRWLCWQLAIAAVAIVLVLALTQFSTPSVCCGDFDGYYHIKWSQILWQGFSHGHLPKFTWLPLTTLGPDTYADQHFLFHIFLIPFTWFGNLRLGAKIATTVLSSLAVFSLYWLMVRYRIRYSLLWLLALLGCSWIFYARLDMTKAQGLSILFIVIGIWLLFERKYHWLALVGFLYVWSYNLFVMLGVLAVMWAIVLWWSEKRLEWRPIAWATAGIVAGLVVNPYFPRNLTLFFEHLKAKSGEVSIAQGTGFEWYSPSSWDFLGSSFIACAAMVIGFIALGYGLSADRERRTGSERALLFFLFSSFLLLISIRSNRFLEYWPPFAVLFAAFAMQPVWSRESTEDAGSCGSLERSERGPLGRVAIVTAALILAAGVAYNVSATRAKIVPVTKGSDHYKAGAEWMLKNIPPGALIYNVNWSDFPKLFFYDTVHSYISGLDPLYLQDRHPVLAELNDNLSSQEERDPGGALRTTLAKFYPAGVNYVFVGDDPTPPPPEWFRYIRLSGKFKPLYRDDECFILQVLDVADQSLTGDASVPVQILPQPAQQAPSSPGRAASKAIRHFDSPEQRAAAAAQVKARFGGDIFGTDEENYEGGGPALVVHNDDATREWAQNLFTHDASTLTGEALWQLGFRHYIVTNGDETWISNVDGNEKYRPLFEQGAGKH
jgi:hypothetical protein